MWMSGCAGELERKPDWIIGRLIRGLSAVCCETNSEQGLLGAVQNNQSVDGHGWLSWLMAELLQIPVYTNATSSATNDLADQFFRRFGRKPAYIARAPGRVK
jgi:hypothetical protein